MNYGMISESLWRYLGLHSAGQRPDYLRQEIMENVNAALDELYGRTHWWWHYLDYTSLAITAGTSAYELSDYCRLPIGLKLGGDDEDFINFCHFEQADRMGLRQTSYVQSSSGPFMWTWTPSRRTAEETGTCTVSDANTTVTVANTITLATTDAGKVCRINGEPADYLISSVNTTANTLVIDRAYRSPRAGKGTSDTGTNRSGVKFEISPGPVWKVELLPTPASNMTVYYRFARRHRYLLADTDVPEIDRAWVHLLEIGAKRNLSRYVQESDSEKYTLAFERGLEQMRKSNVPNAGPGQVYYQSPVTRRVAPWPGGRSSYNDVFPRR
jgi:hypothetical protein